jgi:hypothetical protein
MKTSTAQQASAKTNTIAKYSSMQTSIDFGANGACDHFGRLAHFILDERRRPPADPGIAAVADVSAVPANCLLHIS